MITVITGLTGSGKTELMTRLVHKEWKAGAKVFTNYGLNFSEGNEDILRWHNLDELYHLSNGIIMIDEGQTLFNARQWASLPPTFASKITQHRKHNLDIYTTTQDLGQIDVFIRRNIHEVFNCEKLFRWPRNDRVKPALMLVRIVKKTRVMTGDQDRVQFAKVASKLHLISRYFTKDLYNTYGDVNFEPYICQVRKKDGKWEAKMISRDLVVAGKARMW